MENKINRPGSQQRHARQPAARPQPLTPAPTGRYPGWRTCERLKVPAASVPAFPRPRRGAVAAAALACAACVGAFAFADRCGGSAGISPASRFLRGRGPRSTCQWPSPAASRAFLGAEKAAAGPESGGDSRRPIFHIWNHFFAYQTGKPPAS